MIRRIVAGFQLRVNQAVDITDSLLGENSPYISNLVYDIDVRLVFIECFDNPKTQKPTIRLVFPGILTYAETNLLDQPDDENIDDIMSIIQLDKQRISITTYKKEITLTLTDEPFVEKV